MSSRMSCNVQLVNSFIGGHSQYGHVDSASKFNVVKSQIIIVFILF